jgi:hypothetical protein
VNGFGANLRLLRKCLEGVDRSQVSYLTNIVRAGQGQANPQNIVINPSCHPHQVQLMVKIGMDTRAPVEAPGSQWIMRGDAASLRADVEFALEALGTDYIDIIVLCRVSTTPIEESVREGPGLPSQVQCGQGDFPLRLTCPRSLLLCDKGPMAPSPDERLDHVCLGPHKWMLPRPRTGGGYGRAGEGGQGSPHRPLRSQRRGPSPPVTPLSHGRDSTEREALHRSLQDGWA